jgi:hypothetical protein
MSLWPIYFREFLEAVCMEEGPFRDIFGWPIRAVRKSLSFSHIFFLPATIRTLILFRLKVSQNLQLCVPDLRKMPRSRPLLESHLSIKLSFSSAIS